jgi:D-alanine-D-alanine ligase-like ATP-grasp enzyme
MTKLKKKPRLYTYSKNPSFAILRAKLKETYKRLLEEGFYKNVFISHGSRTRLCVNRFKNLSMDSIIINSPEAIKRASDKFLLKKEMQRLDLGTPKFDILKDELELNFPVVIKERKGFGGKNMHLVLDEEQYKDVLNSISNKEDYYVEEMFNPRKYFENHIKTTREYRVVYSPELSGHTVKYNDPIDVKDFDFNTVSNGVITVLKKLYKDPSIATFGKNLSKENVYFTKEFTIEKPDLWFNIISQIRELMQAIGLDYGAVDVLVCPNKRRGQMFSIVEINTAPGFSESEDSNTINRYNQALNEIIIVKNNEQNLFNLIDSLCAG